MKPRIIAGIVLGLALYLAFLLALAPASLVGWAVTRFSHQRAQLQDVTGSLWHGSASTIRLNGPGGQVFQLSPLTWRIGLGRLLHGQVLADINVGRDAAASRAVVVVSRHHLQLEEFHSPLPPVALKTLLPQLDISKMTGGGR